MAQKKSTLNMQKQKEKKGMQFLAATFLFLFIFGFVSSVFAQEKNVQRVRPMKDGIGDQGNWNETQEFIKKEEIVKISVQNSIVDVSAAPDALVNNNDGSSGTGNFTQSETDILAWGSNVLIGFNDSGSFSTGSHFTGFSYSTDGGATFTDGGTFPSTDFGDPAIGRNETSGRIYFSTLGSSTIQVFRSDDDGVTWMSAVNGTPGGSSEDKQWLAVDNFAGAGNGNVYLMSRRFGGTSGIYMFRSTDDGASFTPNGGVSIFSGGQGAFVAVGPDHSVYAFYYNGSTNIQMRKSTDLGVTFGSAVTVVSGLIGGVNGDMDLSGMRQGTASFSYFRSNSFPHASVNPTSGHIYVTFNDNPAGVDKADIYMVMSTDGGATWSGRTQVNDDGTTTDQWQPTIAVTPDGNNLGIFYYSRQEDTANNNLFKFYGRLATVSGSTVSFSPGFPISDVASLPEFGRDNVVNSVYMGDYNHATATSTGFHVVWSDNRDDLPGGGSRKDPNCYYEFIQIGPPCPVGVASNPNPASGTMDVDINLPQVSWTNGSGATSIDVFFDGANVYSGPPVTSYTIPAPLNYSTTYSWRVDTNNDSCTAYGSSWTFTTMGDPNIVNLFCDDFEAGAGGWTITNDGGTCVWEVFNPPYPNAYTLPATSTGGVLSADSDECGSGTTLLSTATLTNAIDATLFNAVWLEFDNDWNAIDAADFCYVDVSTDGGTNWQNVLTFDGTDVRNTHEMIDITSFVANSTFSMRFVSVQPGWDWWWTVDNVCVYGTDPVPVELTSFTASASGVDVQLNWSTATETNNQGFYVERMFAGSSFEQTGFVAGFGTTTEPKTYSFTDPNLAEGNYTYRIKQVDFDGTYEYSEEVNVVVELPLEYGLDQNYPNPFNPSTTIKYSLADDGFVKLAIYNMLGEEVASIVNATQKAGRYEVNFNASDLSSGVYVYRIEAGNFVSSKKLMLLK